MLISSYDLELSITNIFKIWSRNCQFILHKCFIYRDQEKHGEIENFCGTYMEKYIIDSR